MRKNLLYLFVTILLPIAPVLAQNQETATRILLPSGSHHPAFGSAMTKSTACGVDTIVYPYLKELAFTAPADSFFIDAMVGNVRTASQAYHIEEPISIHGVQFWGGAYTTNPSYEQSMQVRAYLYSVDAFNMPVAKLDSADVFVGSGDDFYEAIFTTPYVYGQNFAVAVRSVPNDTLTVITNNAGNVWSTDYSESLAWRRFGSGTWNSTLSFFGQDLEYMIFPIVSYTLSASYATGNPTECTGTGVDFMNTSSAIYSNRMLNLHAFDEYWGFASADSTFTWNYGDGSPGENSLQGGHTYTAAGAYDVALTGELMGYYMTCSDTYTASVPVLETPVAGLNLSGTVEFCEGGTIALTATPATDVTYEWYMDSTIVADSTGGTFTITESGDYYVVVDNVCGTDTSDAVMAVLSAPPVAGLNMAGTVDVCDGDIVLLEGTPSTGVDYQWLLDGAPVIDSTFGSYQTTVAGDYSLIVSNTCGEDTSDVVSIVVNTEPVASLNVNGALTFCEGGSVTLTAEPANGVNYEWLMNGISMSDSVDGTFIVTESGTYTVIASNGCGLDTAVLVTVEVNNLPQQPGILENGGVLEVDSLTVGPGFLYQWSADGSEIPDATTDTLVPLANGSYTVTVTDANGCSNTSEAFEVDNIGLDEQTGSYLVIAPNPTQNVFTVSFTPGTLHSLTLFDANGRLIAVQLPEPMTDTMTFDLSAYGNGVYLLRADGASVTVERIILSK